MRLIISLFLLFLLFLVQLPPAYAQLLSGHDIKISNTGNCSINIGVNGEGKLPSIFHCEFIDQKALQIIDRKVSELGWIEYDTGQLTVFLPSSWRMREYGMSDSYVATPRPGTIHLENEMEVSIGDALIRKGGMENYSNWSTTHYGPSILPNGVDPLDMSSLELEIIAKAHLFFSEIYEARQSFNENGDRHMFTVSDVLNHLSDSSEMVNIASFPYCEGGDYEDYTAPVLFTSNIDETSSHVSFSIYINRQAYFPLQYEYRNYEDVVSSKERFSAFDVYNTPLMRRVTCSGKEIESGDIYSICAKILSQVIINNAGQLSC